MTAKRFKRKAAKGTKTTGVDKADPEPNAASTNVPEQRDVLTVEQVATYLQISRATVYNLMSKEGLPHARLGSSSRFLRTAVLDWVERKTTKHIE